MDKDTHRDPQTTAASIRLAVSAAAPGCDLRRCGQREERSRARRGAQCTAPAEILLERAQAREAEPGAVSDAGPAIVERQLRELEPLHDVPGYLRAKLRTDRPLEEVLVELETRLDGLLGGKPRKRPK